ncbi:MAG: SDR family oxidoreductase [Gemmatimonadetes bacterium]|nr:SDR family oxidoreductase [Gemmatimonadota bacterium]
MPNLTGKVAIVTGSTKGIGRAIAEQLHAAGASVVVSSRTAADVAAVAKRLGPRALGIACDVADPTACQSLVDQTVSRLGRVDILVNNAGFGIFKSIADLTIDEWRRQIDVNLGGVFYCSKAALPHLAATGDGFIINIGSLAGRNYFAGGTAYNASKAGLIGMTEAMMLDVRQQNVRVSVIMPGSVNTWFRGATQSSGRSWPLEADDVALAVVQMLDYPKGAHPSRIELRPSRPEKG